MNKRALPAGADGFVAMAVQLALDNARRQQRPYGAVIVRGDQVIGEGVNTVLRDGDPTAHAEVAAVRDACARSGTRRLTDAYMATSCHPCEMCRAVTRLGGIGLVIHAGTFGVARSVLPDLVVEALPDARVDEPFNVFAQWGLPGIDLPPATI